MIFAGIFLNSQPTVAGLAALINASLAPETPAPDLYMQIARILSGELAAQLANKTDGIKNVQERVIIEPLTEDAIHAKQLASASAEVNRKKKQKIQV